MAEGPIGNMMQGFLARSPGGSQSGHMGPVQMPDLSMFRGQQGFGGQGFSGQSYANSGLARFAPMGQMAQMPSFQPQEYTPPVFQARVLPPLPPVQQQQAPQMGGLLGQIGNPGMGGLLDSYGGASMFGGGG